MTDEYVVYFANENFEDTGEFEFEFTVWAKDEEEARGKAIRLFHEQNPELNLDDYVHGFLRN